MVHHDPAVHGAELHRQAIVIDGHSDILVPIADGKMRLAQKVVVPDPATWKPPLGVDAGSAMAGFSAHTRYFGPMGQYDLPRFREGGVTAQAFAIYLGDHEVDRALQRGLSMTWWLHREVEENEDLEMVTTVADVHRVKRLGKMGAIMTLEGLEPLGFDVHVLDLYYALGLRMASLTHNRRNCYADGTQLDVRGGGLTDLGKQAIRRMNELGIVIDLVHLNEVGFWEVLDLTRAPVVFSHTSPWVFPRPGQPKPFRAGFDRVRDRERLEAIARNGGVLGVISFGQEDLDQVVGCIEVLLEALGPDHVGLGSDLYGLDTAPRGLEDIAQLPALTRRLVERGHADEVILKILGGNFLRVFARVWKAAG